MVLVMFISFTPKILVIGDSLSTPYHIPVEEGWVHLVSQKIPGYKTINDSKNGRKVRDYKANGGGYKIVIIELGGNDMLSFGPEKLPDMKEMIRNIIKYHKSKGSKVLLLGITIYPELFGGMENSKKALEKYRELSEEEKIELVPFLLEGLSPDNFIDDRIHPNKEGHQIMARNVWEKIKKII